MAFEFNPTTGKLDSIADPGGANTQIQFNDNGEFGGDADLTYNKATNKLTSGGDVELNDGGFTTTTLQVVSAIDATFTARIDNGTPGNAGTTMTLTSAATGTFALGQKISGTGVTAGTTIVSLASGSLGANASTYVVSVSQSVAATAFQSGTDKVISLPNRTGTVGLVAGSTTQIIQNLNGAYAGVSTLTADSNGNITLAGRLTNTYTSIASNPAKRFTGTWFSGGSTETTKPHFLIEPSTVTTSNTWSPNGTGIGVNATSTFAGNLLDLQVNGTSRFRVEANNVRVFANGYYLDTTIGYYLQDGVGGVLNASGFKGILTSSLSWVNSANSNSGTIDLALFRDAPNTLAQRNGTNAQTFRLYNTLTGTEVGATGNYERGFLKWNSSVLELGTEVGSGGGTVRPVRITAATLKLPNLPTYADNAAALAGSLVAGDVYKTATGELRITV